MSPCTLTSVFFLFRGFGFRSQYEMSHVPQESDPKCYQLRVPSAFFIVMGV